MAKYNITEKKEKEAAYRSLVSPKMMDEMQEKIMNIIVMQKKYRDKDFSAKRLAEELGTNTRYISAVVNVRFHMNYTSFVNKYRIDEAMTILVDKRFQDLRMEELSHAALAAASFDEEERGKAWPQTKDRKENREEVISGI